MSKSMVVAAQPQAAEAGQLVLETGGNAFDAAVVAALVQCVVDPINTSLGGSGCAVYFDTRIGRTGCASFMSRAGSKVRCDMWQKRLVPIDVGHASACVPGNVRGLASLLQEHGTLSWSEALGPALSEARKGLLVTRPLIREWAVDVQGNADPYTRLTPDAQKVMLRDGRAQYRFGEVMPLPDLVHTLENLQQAGPDWLYTGEFAQIAAEDSAQHGGWLAYEDFAHYQVRHRDPVSGRYHGMDYFGAPPPASGSSVLHILRILSGDNLPSLEHNSVAYLHLLAEATKAEFANREQYLGDDARYAEAISERNAARVRALIRPDRAAGPCSYLPEPGTTHLGVVDAAGNAVAMTHSIGNAFGSGVMPPGTGVLLNGHMDSFACKPRGPNEIGPGKARRTAISSTVMLRNGKPALVVGASGSARIITSTVQAILNIVDLHMSASEAIYAPRMRYVDGKLGLERRIPLRTAEALAKMGHVVEHSLHAIDPRYGLCHAICVDDSGEVSGASDPRSEGMALKA